MKTKSLTSWILLADMLWAAPALLGAMLLRYGTNWDDHALVFAEALLPFLAATWVIWSLLSTWTRLDGFAGGWHLPAVVTHVLLSVGGLMAVLLSAGYLMRQFVSRLALVYFGVLLFLGFVLIRYVACILLRRKYRRGEVSRVVIAGAGRVARELAAKLERHPEMLCKVVGFLCPEDLADEMLGLKAESQPCATVSTLGIVDFLRKQCVNELILALPYVAWPEVLNLAARCRECGVGVSLVPQPYELYLSKPSFTDLDGLPVLQLREPLASVPLLYVKRVVDLAFGLLLSIAALPIVLGSALILRLRRGRAFRWELRCGLRGKPFHMLRLNIVRGAPHDSVFEHILERLSVTELPQLWNVLRGDMSLVGPRPESPERVRRYSDWQQERLSVKPGMTGLAQIHGLREHSSSEEKTRFDLQYRLNPSVAADCALLLRTIWTLAMRAFQLSSEPRPSRPELAPGGPQELTRESFKVREVLSSAHSAQSSSD